MEDDATSYVECTQQYTPPVSKCTGISTVKAMNSLDFDRSVFTSEEIDTGEVEPDSSDDDNEPAAEAAPTSSGIEADGGQNVAVTVSGEPEDYDGIRGKLKAALRNHGGGPMSLPQLFGSASVDEGEARVAISHLVEKGELERDPETDEISLPD